MATIGILNILNFLCESINQQIKCITALVFKENNINWVLQSANTQMFSLGIEKKKNQYCTIFSYFIVYPH